MRAELQLRRLTGTRARDESNGVVWVERRRRFLTREFVPGGTGGTIFAALSHDAGPEMKMNFPSWLAAMAALLLLGAGCTERDAVRVKLLSRAAPGRDLTRLEIQAQVTGPQEGLRYRWFSISGECDPQRSDAPMTTFKFADNASRDRVSLEVWHNDQRVAQSEIDVMVNEERIRMELEHPNGVNIFITNIPPYEPSGGRRRTRKLAGW